MDLITILLVVLAWVCIGNVIFFIFRWYLYRRQLRLKNHNSADCVAVIESVKNADKDYYQHVTALINQDHLCFRIIFCLSDTHDPSFQSLSTFFKLNIETFATQYHITRQNLDKLKIGSSGLKSVDIVVAGTAETCSQKIFNQLSAYDLLLPEDQIVAWVDADTCLSAAWLNDLVYPLYKKTFAASTGYRCLAPGGHDWSSAFISVINSSILTLLGDPWQNSFWGGSMAMTRQVFEKFKVPEYVKQCFSDDESVAALLKNNRIPIYFSYAVLPLGKIKYTFKEMLNFGQRQYMCARFYYKFHVFIAGLLLSAFTLVFFFLLTKLLFTPSGFNILLFTGLVNAMVIRGIIRFSFIRYILKIDEYNLKCLFLETLGTPLVHLLHLGICFSALMIRKVEWAGITYKIKGPFNVKIV
jgi:ceramide glucosyltransferase